MTWLAICLFFYSVRAFVSAGAPIAYRALGLRIRNDIVDLNQVSIGKKLQSSSIVEARKQGLLY